MLSVSPGSPSLDPYISMTPDSPIFPWRGESSLIVVRAQRTARSAVTIAGAGAPGEAPPSNEIA